MPTFGLLYCPVFLLRVLASTGILLVCSLQYASAQESATPSGATTGEKAGSSASGNDAPQIDELRILTYNIHHGEGADGSLDLERIAQVIRSFSPDLVAVQEVDQRVERSGSVDQAATLAQLTGMHVVFGKNIDLQGGGYGNAVLSKFPIAASKNHALPRFADGEQRGVLEVKVRPGDGRPDLTLFATHLDHRRDPRERIASAKAINEMVEDVETPIAILAGDLNATPDSEPMQQFFQKWRPSSLSEHKTSPAADPVRQIDYILYRPGDPLVPVATKVLDEPVASDHRPLGCVFALQRYSANNERPLQRIAFGSCVQQDRPIPILETVLASAPDLLLMLGDNIYADTAEMQVMRRKYDTLAENRAFAALRSLCPTLATWDDHDYGVNDGGSRYAEREAAQEIFVDFWNDPLNAPRRSRPGIYTSSLYGPPGQRVQVIMLDTRYFRSPLKEGEKRTGGPYVADSDSTKTILGETQWQWIFEQLQVPADLRIIGSSIQAVASAAGQETWANLPLERERLFRTIRDAGANGVIIVSGDRHWAELSVEPDALGYPLYDITSSSLNQKHGRGTPTENEFRDLADTYHEENFGLIDLDWEAKQPAVTLRIVDTAGSTRLERRIPLESLRTAADR